MSLGFILHVDFKEQRVTMSSFRVNGHITDLAGIALESGPKTGLT